jgi:L-alanine-DL-glutamate epimerase-like enolase superfamily enzyme
MRIAAIAARTIRWPIAASGAARGRTERAAVVLEVRSRRGATGLGEAAPLPGLSIDSLADAERAIAAVARRAPFEVADREAIYALAADTAIASARFAIETALLDALAREHAVSLAHVLREPVDRAALRDGHLHPTPSESNDRPGAALESGFEPRVQRVSAMARGAHVGAAGTGATGWLDSASSTSARIPLAAVVDDPAAARAAFAAGIRCLKLKLGGSDDLDRIFAIAAAAPGARLRIDGNRSWPRGGVAARLARLAALAIDYVEEPCIDSHLVLDEALPCKLALDESLAALTPEDLRTALASPRLAAVVLKPTLLGGLSAAIELAARARRAGVAAIVSHGLEGPVGTAACAELALALGGDQPVGLAAHPALAGWDLAVAQLANDHVRAAAGPGLGFADLALDKLANACAARTERGDDPS